MMELIRKYDYKIYFELFRKIDNRNIRKFLYIVLSPLLLVLGLINYVYEKTVGRVIVNNELKSFLSKKI